MFYFSKLILTLDEKKVLSVGFDLKFEKIENKSYQKKDFSSETGSQKNKKTIVLKEFQFNLGNFEFDF